MEGKLLCLVLKNRTFGIIRGCGYAKSKKRAAKYWPYSVLRTSFDTLMGHAAA